MRKFALVREPPRMRDMLAAQSTLRADEIERYVARASYMEVWIADEDEQPATELRLFDKRAEKFFVSYSRQS